MATYVCGDIHADLEIRKLRNDYWEEQKSLTKEDHVIFLGDFGFPWKCSMVDGEVIMDKTDKYWLDWLVAKNYTTLVVLGNHEGIYSIYNELPLVYYEPVQGYVKELKMDKGSIYYLLRDSLYTLEDKKILVIGGALSIDKLYRTSGVSWWVEEELTRVEQENILDILDTTTEFDYVLSHTAPSFLIPTLVHFSDKIHDPTAVFLDFIENRIEFTQWHFGHFHTDVVLHDKYHCHYNELPYKLSTTKLNTIEEKR